MTKNITGDIRKKATLLHYAGEEVFDLFYTLHYNLVLVKHLNIQNVVGQKRNVSCNVEYEIYICRQWVQTNS